jgi:hypothetical protein
MPRKTHAQDGARRFSAGRAFSRRVPGLRMAIIDGIDSLLIS